MSLSHHKRVNLNQNQILNESSILMKVNINDYKITMLE